MSRNNKNERGKTTKKGTSIQVTQTTTAKNKKRGDRKAMNQIKQRLLRKREKRTRNKRRT
jgi:hypothetical protein